MRLLESALADVSLIDVAPGLAKGKALDLEDAAQILRHEKEIYGGEDYSLCEKSDVIVITAGLARQPGMTRDDLLKKNAQIAKSVISEINSRNTNAILIVVTNPVDNISYLTYKLAKRPKNKVLGMAGVLDSARMRSVLRERLGLKRKNAKSLVIGAHNATMVPLIGQTYAGDKPVREVIDESGINEACEKTSNRGAEIVGNLKTGSAYFAPSAACAEMIKAILSDSGEIMPVSAYLEGEYGLKDICLGVPAVLDKTGIKQISQIPLSEKEKAALARSAEKIAAANQKIKDYFDHEKI
jgi:malate dehydrogenase